MLQTTTDYGSVFEHKIKKILDTVVFVQKKKLNTALFLYRKKNNTGSYTSLWTSVLQVSYFKYRS